MCIAIFHKADTRLSQAQIRAGWRVNRDGAGMAFVNDAGSIVIRKGYLTEDGFIAAYEQALEEVGGRSPFLVHLRIGTSGNRNNAANTHPFAITPEIGPPGAMIHNGILFTPTGTEAGPAEDRRSDTRVVCESLGNILALEDVLRAKERIGRSIGGGNKFAFLYANKEHAIVNEHMGHWEDGIWFSNNHSCNVRSA